MRLIRLAPLCLIIALAGCSGGGNDSSAKTQLQPPIASAGGPYTSTVGTAVSFSGSASSDPQAQSLTYAWNFGDGGTGTGVSPTHTYTAGGSYTVSLTVTDTSSLTGTATSKATILAPPVANPGGPYSGTVATAVSFSGSGSSDPQGQTLTYAWNFGDGSTGTGVSPTHTYAASGVFTVSLTVTDTSNLTGTTTAKATILGLPVANAGGPYAGVVGTAVSFSGSASSDPQGQTLTYAWNFGDGGTGMGVAPSHTYTSGGTYTVSLTVTDASSLTGTATSKATIIAPPVANAGGPYTGTTGTALNFSGSGSSDPQGQSLTYAWNFGDGGTGTGVSPSHTYTAGGTYTVSLTVTDASNLNGTATSKATIIAPPVANAGGPYTGTAGIAVTFTGSGSSDPQGQTLTYAWNFGDGGTGTGASPTHTYSAIGPFTISLTVTDTSNLTGTATSKATIAPGPPVANAGGSYVGHLEVPVNFSAHGSTDPQGEVLTYAWSFGDSTTGSGVSPTHTYGAVGTYTVSLTATNTSGLSSTVTVSATIAPPPSGAVRSGLMPVSGAHVYLFAANTTGYGQPSVSLLNAASTGLSDSVGAYVSTAQDGSFIWTGNYICTPGAQVYAYALGGNAGNGNNAASGLLAILGSCPSAGSFPTANPLIWVNEVSTVASAYAFSGFATDAVHVSSSGTALAQVGIANAFANAGNLATLSTGVALATTPAGNGTAPQATINTLADILAACVNTDSSTSNACSTLFSNAESSGSTGTLATDTATAAINIAHNPGSNIAPLYALSTANPPFSNALTAQPNDFTIGLSFTGGGLNGSATAIAIDGSGNAWVAVHLAGIGGGQVGALSEFSSTGVALSPSIGFTGGGLYYPEAVAIDGSGDVWITNLGIASVSKFSNAGAALSPSSGFTGGGVGDAYSIAIDGSGDAWVANSGAGVLHGSVSEFSSAGVALSPSTGYTGGGLDGARSIAVDGSGNAWITNPNLYGSGSNTLSKLSSGGVALSPSTGDTGGGLYDPVSIAIDSSGDAWAVNAVGSVSKFSHVGAALSPSTGGLYDVGGYFGGGLSSDGSIAIDGSGNAWIANYDSGSLSEFSSTGTPLSPSSGYGGKAISGTVSSSGIAIDGSGDVWTVFYNAPAALYETIGVATPVITPISAGLPATPTSDGSSKLGTRP